MTKEQAEKQAEKEWKDWDFENVEIPVTDAIKVREAFKAALRAEIEKQNKDKEFPQMLWTISEILNLIDNVKPLQ